MQIEKIDQAGSSGCADGYHLVARRPGMYRIESPANRHFLDIQVSESNVGYQVIGREAYETPSSPVTFVFVPAGKTAEIESSGVSWSVQIAVDPGLLSIPDQPIECDYLYRRDDVMAMLGQQLVDHDQSRSLDRNQIDAILTVILMRLMQHLADNPPKPQCLQIQSHRIRAVIEHIEKNFSERLGLAVLAEIAGQSPYHFARTFRAAMGQSPHQFIVETRVAVARQRLTKTEESIASIAYDCGFGSQSHMTSTFTKVLGATPGSFRR